MHVFHATEHLQQTAIFPLPNIIKLSRRRLMPRFRLSPRYIRIGQNLPDQASRHSTYWKVYDDYRNSNNGGADHLSRHG